MILLLIEMIRIPNDLEFEADPLTFSSESQQLNNERKYFGHTRIYFCFSN